MKKFGVFLIISAILISMMATVNNVNTIAVEEVPEPQSIIISV
jgi:uncharacterized membrane protein YidH (DUF202 family)